MKAYVRLLATWLGVDARTALSLLSDDEAECLAVEALCSRAVRL